MLGCTEDAEDVLQEVFVAAYNAMVADERPIAVRPWLYRIARNRCLNHLRKPTADGQDTMDTHPHLNGVTTLERVQNREEFRSLLDDVSHLPETQRSALLLREIDAMSYEEIAQAMDTTVPGVKSLLVRARIALAESSQARQLTCDEVRLDLAEAAEGLAKASGPVRRHVKSCEPCREFRAHLRSDSKALAALFPAGPLLALHGLIFGKLSALFGGGGGGAAAGGGAGAGGVAGAGAAGAGAAGGAGAAAAGGTAVSGAAIGGAAAAGGAAAGGAGAAAAGGAAAIGTKAAAGLATAAIIAGGAAEIKYVADKDPSPKAPANRIAEPATPPIVAATPPVDPASAQPVPAPASTATTPPDTVTVPPQPTDPAVIPPTGAVTPLPDRTTKHKHHTPIANTDSNVTGSTQTGPVTTGVEPATCDADGDGAPDPGAPSTCTPTTDGTTTTEVESETVTSTPYAATMTLKQRKVSTKKKKVRQQRARAR
jgi:RNA polymerase sigma factor (sigma-70 family)